MMIRKWLKVGLICLLICSMAGCIKKPLEEKRIVGCKEERLDQIPSFDTTINKIEKYTSPEFIRFILSQNLHDQELAIGCEDKATYMYIISDYNKEKDTQNFSMSFQYSIEGSLVQYLYKTYGELTDECVNETCDFKRDIDETKAQDLAKQFLIDFISAPSSIEVNLVDFTENEIVRKYQDLPVYKFEAKQDQHIYWVYVTYTTGAIFEFQHYYE